MSAGWLAFGYCFGWIFLSVASAVDGGALDKPIGLALMAVIGRTLLTLPLAVWMGLPVIAAAGLAGASLTRVGAVAFLVLEALLCASTIALFWYYRDDGAIIGLPVWPVMQCIAIVPVFVVALACGWRMRPDFLMDQPRPQA